MKTLSRLTWLISLIILLVIHPVNLSAQLRGAYTIDPDGGPFPNFVSIYAALDSLYNQGVDSAVVFNIADGDYNGQYYFGAPAPGMSAVNTVTFQGNESDSTLVRLWWNQSSDLGGFVIHLLDGTNHFIFRKLTIEATGTDYARVLRSSYCSNFGVVFENCLFKGKHQTGTSPDFAIIYHHVSIVSNKKIAYRNNCFINGTYGIYIHRGDNGITNVEITGNTFLDQSQWGVKLDKCHGVIIDNNDFSLSNTDAYAIDLAGCNEDISIRNNKISIASGSLPAVYLTSCIGSGVTDRGIIANNMITIDGTTENEAIHLDQSTYQGVYHNSVNVLNTNDWSSALYINQGNNNEILNNNLSNYGGGLAYRVLQANAVSSIDYNNYYTTGWHIAYWVDTRYIYYYINQLREANGDDAHSRIIHPRFHSPTDLHTSTYWLDGKGVSGLGINTDIDGESRSDPPDLGADEFDPVLPLAGEYTIGGTDPDYVTLREAFDSLDVLGVIGPTTFKIRSGEYNEYIDTVNTILGANWEDTIVFTSESGNPEDVILYYSTNDAEDYIIDLLTPHITIMNISIAATGVNEGGAIRITHRDNINIINNILSLANTTDPVLSISGRDRSDIAIMNNSFIKGSKGLTFWDNEDYLATNTFIIGNTFSGAKDGAIELKDHFAPRVKRNQIVNSEYPNFVPIVISGCDENLEVTGNIISNVPGDYGIKLENCFATNPFEGLVANNMIRVGDTAMAAGIEIDSCKRMNLYHNSINITSSDSVNGKAIHIHDNNEKINIVNNIITNSGEGYALFVEDPADVTLSDFNGIYSAGTNFSSWDGTDYFSLDSLKDVSGMDEHSLSVDPMFYSESDLHSRQFAFMGAATPLEEVKYDIDHHPRDSETPDIGAMEFFCDEPEFNVHVSVACIGDTTIFIDNSTDITEGATYEWDFDGDFSPEMYSDKPNDTVMHPYDTAGTYTLVFIVHQLEGCDHFTSVPVNVVALPKLEIESKGAYCDNEDGQATVDIIDPDGTYTYYWSNGTTDSVANNLALGTYTVAVSDSNGCTSTDEVTISEAIEVVATELQPSICGKNTGIAKVEVSGGVEPYSIVWSDGDTTAIDSFMVPGLHYVNIIDANDCYAQGSVVIGNDGSGPEIELESTTNNLCYGNMDGAIDISISGGELPYKILWSNGSRSEDLENLEAGIYDVVVMDSDSCSVSGSYIVTEPPKLSIGSVTENARCNEHDGRAAVMVSGGTEPYLYSWSSGGYHPVEENLFAGIYSVTITDDNGCEESKSVVVNSIDGPVITLKSITGVSCTDSISGSIEVSTGGGTPLYTWLWTPGGYTKPKIDSLTKGVYEVEVTDATGCTGYNYFEIKEDPPAENPICLVTVDTLTGKNMIVWERLDRTNAAYYVIYRESSLKGEYVAIGTRHPDSVGIFIDSVADPSIRSWKYRLSVVDSCGNESELSDHHKTMHLTMNIGLDGDINLIWDHYEGFLVVTYEIWRYDSAGGWTNLDNLASDQTSYTDKDPPRVDLTYYIETDHPTGCIIYDKKAGTLNSSKSNRQRRLKEDAGQDTTKNYLIDQNVHSFSLYPNPSSGIFNLDLELMNTDDIEIRIFDVTGKLVRIRNYKNIPFRLNTRIDLSGNVPGIYHMQVKTNRTLIHRVLIRE